MPSLCKCFYNYAFPSPLTNTLALPEISERTPCRAGHGSGAAWKFMSHGFIVESEAKFSERKEKGK